MARPLHILVNNAQVCRGRRATSVLLAASPLLDGAGGRDFEDCNEATIVERRTADFTGVAPYAVDAANAHRLWQVASQLIGVEP